MSRLAGRVVRARALGDRRVLVASELASAGVPGPPAGVGLGLAAPTILEHGSDDLKRRLLRPIATGEHRWCQLFSEPGYGSDLAGLVTRADRDGDEWVVNGQKLWTTSAHHAHYGLLVARTDWDAPKHRGLTCFAIDMRQPGIEARPVRQMNGHASFNEVFFTDARVPRRRHHRRSRRGMAGGARDARPRAAARPPSAADDGPSGRRSDGPGGGGGGRRAVGAVRLVPPARRTRRAGSPAGEVARPGPRSGDPAGAGPPRIDRPHRRMDKPPGPGGTRAGSTAWRRGLARQVAREPHRQGIGRRARARRGRSRDARRAGRACSTA